jgi:hypothetical protein
LLYILRQQFYEWMRLERIWEVYKTRQENFRSCKGVRARNKRADHYSVHWIVGFRAAVLERGLWRRGAVEGLKGEVSEGVVSGGGSVPREMA